MAQTIRAVAANFDTMSMIPGPSIMEEEEMTYASFYLTCVLWYMNTHTCTHTHTHK